MSFTAEHRLAGRVDIEREVRHQLVRRLVGESGFAELTHVLLVVLSGFLVWPDVPHDNAIRMMAAVTTAALGRGYFRSRANRRNVPDITAMRTMRVGVLALGLAWAASMLLVGPAVPFGTLALMTVMFSGLVAGATVSLLPDPVSFYTLLGTLLGSVAVTFAIHGEAQQHVLAVILIGVFGLAMSIFYRRSHAALVTQFRTACELEQSTAAVREAREAEQYLVRIIEATTDHVGIAGPDGLLRYMNRAGREMLGLSASEDVTGMTVMDIVPERLRASVRDERLPALAREGHWSGESVLLHRDGTEIPVSLVVLAHRDENGSVESLSAVARDIREQAAARAELQRARDAAEQATAAKSAFLANTSHEIRTPLNGIIGMVELLLDTDLSPDQRRSAELISASGETLLHTINDLLDLSKIEAGQLELERIAFDLHNVVHSTVRLLMSRATDKGLELVSDVGATVPQWVLGDSHRLRQVLSNLVGNAIKFTSEGEVVVSARLQSAGSADGSALAVLFSVRDSGIGIAPEFVQRIFEPFRQVDVSTTRQYGGTGLGLSISRRLVQLMGGTLEVQSAPGEGSDFFFTIPFAPAGDEPHGAAAPDVSLRGVHALVVDDHPTNRRVLGAMLRWAGCAVEEAANVDDAVAIMRDAASSGQPIRLVASDVQMPGRDGFELAAAVRADEHLRTTRIMLLASSAQHGDSQRCKELGVAAYMQKPVARAELVEAAIAALQETSGSAPRRSLITRLTIDESRTQLRVLIAEDNPVNQEVAAAMLRKRGHVVDVVGDGREAVEAVEAVEAAGGNAYDVVLMDLQMPQMDGIQATRELRQRGYAALPIVALTANVSAGEHERCIEAGMSGYLAKPFKPHDLFSAVEGWNQVHPEPAPVPAAPVDLEGLRAMLADAGIEEAGPRMLSLFRSDTPRRLEALAESAQRRDAQGAARAAHALKSAAGSIRAGTLADLLRQAEDAGMHGDTALLELLVPQVTAEYRRVVDYLATHGDDDASA